MSNFFDIIPFAQVGDVGVQLVVQVLDQDGVPVDVSTASSLVIRIGYPDGTSADRTASLLTTGTDGRIKYLTISGDLPQAGDHSIQARVTIAGSLKSSQLGMFVVNQNIVDPA